MESSIPYTQRIIRTNSYVLWSHQLPSHVSNDDEYHIPIRHGKWGHIGFYG